jgi:hypothetical protein
VGDARRKFATICCGATAPGAGMLEGFDRADGADAPSNPFGWRTVISAWLVAFVFAGLFATADAMASRHKPRPGRCGLAGSVIPRHDPSFPGPDEIAASDWLERVRAEAYGGE